MKYFDLHCDALTVSGAPCVTLESLERGDCLLQTFAVCSEKRRGFEELLRGIERFHALLKEGYRFACGGIEEDRVNAFLSVEGGGIGGRIENIDLLYERGVRMVGLCWNEGTELAAPCFPDYAALLKGEAPFTLRSERGLTPFGFEAVERMRELKMLVDLAHASDGAFYDVAAMLRGRGGVLVSHSASDAVHPCARNLTDRQIAAVADLGGVVGLYFCADFLSEDKSREGQKSAVLAHARHILDVGGEDVLAIGSDFDGIEENAYLRSPADMPDLFSALSREFGPRVAEKIARGNASRLIGQCL